MAILESELSIDRPTMAFICDLFYSEGVALQKSRQRAYEISGVPRINIFPSEGTFIRSVLKLLKPKLGVEFGTFFGYSAAWLAETLAPGGKLICIERNQEYCEMALETFKASGVSGSIDLRCCEADDFLASEDEGPVDFCFFDARWADYPKYLEWAFRSVRSGGVILAHNAYAGGFVSLDPHSSDFGMCFSALCPEAHRQFFEEYSEIEREAFIEDLVGMREFLKQISSDKRIASSTVIPSSEGLAMAIVC